MNADDLDPVLLAVTLSLLPAGHPLLAAARAGLEVHELRRARRRALRDASHDIASAWPRDLGHRWVPHDEIARRRAEPGPLARRSA